ncbi:MAG: polyprenol monophosphomannose synthase [SAR202 cluster bacterium]|nr:polyprenol monophosphomannose synthase [SAR202 cluster bacterium]
MTNKKVTVVLPTYNEASNLPDVTHSLFSLDLPTLNVIVVDDGSPDGTGQVAEQLAIRLGGHLEVIHRDTKQGLGTAYVAGFKRAIQNGAEVVIEMDADQSHDVTYLPAFLNHLESSDVVIGSRYVRGGGSEEWSAFRRFISGLGNLGIRWVAGLKVHDATSGFKAFRVSVLKRLDMDVFRCSGFGFQVEMAHACQQMGYRVIEHPIIFKKRADGKSKMSAFIVAEALWKLFFLRWRTQIRN